MRGLEEEMGDGAIRCKVWLGQSLAMIHYYYGGCREKHGDGESESLPSIDV